MIPHIFKSPLTGNWYVSTRWRKNPHGRGFIADRKYDVTDQVRAILAKERRAWRRRRYGKRAK